MTMNLDISTAKGQVSLADEQYVAGWYNGTPGQKYLQTPKNMPAKIDAILLKWDTIVGLAETKCRYNLTLEQFRTKFNDEWLITAEKVETGITIAEQFCVPLYGFLYLVDDDVLMVQNLSEAKMRKEVTPTQKTINGGIALRENVFVDMTECRIYRNIKTDW